MKLKIHFEPIYEKDKIVEYPFIPFLMVVF